MKPKYFHRYKTFVARFVFSFLLSTIGLDICAQLILCEDQNPTFVVPIEVEQNQDNCTLFSLTVTTTFTSPKCEAFMAGEIYVNPCPLPVLLCFGFCYQWRLSLDNVFIEAECTNESTHTFSNLSSFGTYKMFANYRRLVICPLTDICANIQDVGQITINNNVCDFITSSHNNNEPAIILRQDEIVIDCAIQDDKITVLQSATKITALPGASSGTGPNTFFHAFIAPCPGSGKKGDDGGNDYITETISEEKPTDEPQLIDLSAYSISIHPNPTSGEFTLTVQGSEFNVQSSVYIYDLFGRLIYQSSIINHQSSIDISHHSKGIYFIKVIRGEKSFIQKLVHQ